MILWGEFVQALRESDQSLFQDWSHLEPDMQIAFLGIYPDEAAVLVMDLEERFDVRGLAPGADFRLSSIQRGTLTLGDLFEQINARLKSHAGV